MPSAHQRMGRSIIRELLKYTQQPDIISFAGGLPAPELLPIERTQEAACRVLSEHGVQALQYGPTEGFLPLRQFIVDRMGRYGIRAKAVECGDHQRLAAGARSDRQAADQPGRPLLVEEPTYLGALQAWNAYQAEYVACPCDDDGLRTDLLEGALRVGPKFMYVLPNFQNPGGTPCRWSAGSNWCGCRTSMASRSSRTTPTARCVSRGSICRRWSRWTPTSRRKAARRPRLHGRQRHLSGHLLQDAGAGLAAWAGWWRPVEVIDQLVMAQAGHGSAHQQPSIRCWLSRSLKDGFMDEHIRVRSGRCTASAAM